LCLFSFLFETRGPFALSIQFMNNMMDSGNPMMMKEDVIPNSNTHLDVESSGDDGASCSTEARGSKTMNLKD
jgi:hypothetical protein